MLRRSVFPKVPIHSSEEDFFSFFCDFLFLPKLQSLSVCIFAPSLSTYIYKLSHVKLRVVGHFFSHSLSLSLSLSLSFSLTISLSLSLYLIFLLYIFLPLLPLLEDTLFFFLLWLVPMGESWKKIVKFMNIKRMNPYLLKKPKSS